MSKSTLPERLAAITLALEGNRDALSLRQGAYSWSPGLGLAQRLHKEAELGHALYEALTEDSVRWVREDGGENKLAVAISNYRFHSHP